MNHLKTIDICGVNVSAINIPSACAIIDDWIKNREKNYICVAPVATIVDCQRDREYLKIVNNAGMVTPDGMPLVWLGKFSGNKSMDRTYGPDLMLALCQQGLSKDYRHYFYGGQEETCHCLMSSLKKRFEGINIVGQYSPPMRSLGYLEDSSIIDQINDSDADIIWVGLGSPKQDYWLYQHRDKLKAPVVIGIGAAFDFLSGKKKQAPRWMQRSGLEWFFRLCCEPRRLWKRYLVGNSLFLYYITKDCIRKMFNDKRNTNTSK